MTGNYPPPTRDLSRIFEDQAVRATVWTSVLLHARLVGDFEEAKKAQRELDALGVCVRFHPFSTHSRERSIARTKKRTTDRVENADSGEREVSNALP